MTIVILLGSALAGALVAILYAALTKLGHSDGVALFKARLETWRLPHAMIEALFTLVALPLVVVPFAFLVAMPRWLLALGVSEGWVVIASPIVALLGLAVTIRAFDKRIR